MRKLELAFLITFTACASWLAICCAQFVTAARKEITSLDQQIAAIQTQVVGTRKDLDAQLGAFNSTALLAVKGLNGSEAVLLGQTGSLQKSVSQSLAGIDTVAASLNRSVVATDPVIESFHTLLANPDNAKVVRDVRVNLALAGETMAHVRKVADVTAQEAPAMAKSVDSVAASVAGITSDINKITTDVTKPKKWYVKAYDFSRDFANLLRWIP